MVHRGVVLEIAFTLILYAAHRWRWAFAVVNALLGAAFVIPANWLLQEGRVLSSEVVAGIERIGAGESIPITAEVGTPSGSSSGPAGRGPRQRRGPAREERATPRAPERLIRGVPVGLGGAAG